MIKIQKAIASGNMLAVYGVMIETVEAFEVGVEGLSAEAGCQFEIALASLRVACEQMAMASLLQSKALGGR